MVSATVEYFLYWECYCTVCGRYWSTGFVQYKYLYTNISPYCTQNHAIRYTCICICIYMYTIYMYTTHVHVHVNVYTCTCTVWVYCTSHNSHTPLYTCRYTAATVVGRRMVYPGSTAAFNMLLGMDTLCVCVIVMCNGRAFTAMLKCNFTLRLVNLQAFCIMQAFCNTLVWLCILLVSLYGHTVDSG